MSRAKERTDLVPLAMTLLPSTPEEEEVFRARFLNAIRSRHGDRVWTLATLPTKELMLIQCIGDAGPAPRNVSPEAQKEENLRAKLLNQIATWKGNEVWKLAGASTHELLAIQCARQCNVDERALEKYDVNALKTVFENATIGQKEEKKKRDAIGYLQVSAAWAALAAAGAGLDVLGAWPFHMLTFVGSAVAFVTGAFGAWDFLAARARTPLVEKHEENVKQLQAFAAQKSLPAPK